MMAKFHSKANCLHRISACSGRGVRGCRSVWPSGRCSRRTPCGRGPGTVGGAPAPPAAAPAPAPCGGCRSLSPPG